MSYIRAVRCPHGTHPDNRCEHCDFDTSSAELTTLREQLRVAQEALLAAYRHMQSTGAHESYLSAQRAVLETAGHKFDSQGYYVAALTVPHSPEVKS